MYTVIYKQLLERFSLPNIVRPYFYFGMISWLNEELVSTQSQNKNIAGSMDQFLDMPLLIHS